MKGVSERIHTSTVEWIDRIINDVENEGLQAEIRQEVKAFMADYPLYAEEGVMV